MYAGFMQPKITTSNKTGRQSVTLRLLVQWEHCANLAAGGGLSGGGGLCGGGGLQAQISDLIKSSKSSAGMPVRVGNTLQAADITVCRLQ